MRKDACERKEGGREERWWKWEEEEEEEEEEEMAVIGLGVPLRREEGRKEELLAKRKRGRRERRIFLTYF